MPSHCTFSKKKKKTTSWPYNFFSKQYRISEITIHPNFQEIYSVESKALCVLTKEQQLHQYKPNLLASKTCLNQKL